MFLYGKVGVVKVLLYYNFYGIVVENFYSIRNKIVVYFYSKYLIYILWKI